MFILTPFLFLSVAITLLGCSGEVKEAESSSTTPPVTGADSTSVLYLRIGSKWENGGPGQTVDSCIVSSLDPLGEQTCAVSIPEGQLYFSDLSFTYGTNVPALCSIVSFTPYAYRRSTSAAYIPLGELDPVDCSNPNTIEKKCYGGAGPTMITDYPKNTGHYFLPTVTTEATETLPSENTTRWYGGKPWNLLVTNNLVNRASDIPAKQYIGGSMNDYVLSCLDIWAHPLYSIRLTITDEDSEVGGNGIDEVVDWD